MKFFSWFFIIIFAFFFFQCKEVIIKSPNDKREYAYLELENGVKGVVFQDDTSENASISITVKAGSLDNPKEVQGLAHFTEHLLFLGTKDYPDSDHLSKFLSRHNGFNNAFTTSEFTTYFLMVESQALEEALKIYSRFFVSPLFLELYVKRELHAVHSEHSKNLRSDGFIFREILGDLYHPDHPASFFFTGNKKTLDIPGIRGKVIEFYEKFYGAENITFSIQGGKKQNLDDLKRMAQKWLSDIPIRKKVLKRGFRSGKLFPDQKLPSDLKLKTIKKTHNLTYFFYLNEVAFNTNSSDQDFYARSKQYFDRPPYSSAFYIEQIFNCSAPGCLVYDLQKKGWINSMHGGYNFGNSYETTFVVFFSLTELGKNRIDEINQALFQYLNLIKMATPEEWRYQEIQKIRQIEFDFQQKINSLNLVNYFSSMLHRKIPYQNLLKFFSEKFNPEEIKMLLNQIDPEKMIRIYGSQEVTGNQTNQWYDVSYEVTPIPQQNIEEWSEIGSQSQPYSLPLSNDYLPNYPIFLQESNQFPHLIKLEKTNRYELWYKNDISFGDPQLVILFSFELPQLFTSEKQKNYKNILLSYWREVIEHEFYSLFNVGSSVEIYSSLDGLELKLVTFPDYLSKILKKLETILFNLVLDERKFEIYRNENSKKYENLKEETPLSQMFRSYQYLNESFTFFDEDLKQASSDLNYLQFVDFYRDLFKEGKLRVVVLGNTDRDQVDKVDSEVRRIFLESSQRMMELSSNHHRELNFFWLPQISKNQKKTPVVLLENESKDFAFLRVYQSSDRSFYTRATFEVLNKIMRQRYFNLLRTEKQLGYIVGMNAGLNFRNNRLFFFVQSPFAEPFKIAQETDDFLQHVYKEIKNFDQNEFEQIKASLIRGYLEPNQDLKEALGDYLHALRNEDFTFLLDQPIIQAIQSLTLEEVVKIFENTFFSVDRRMMEFWVYPRLIKSTKSKLDQKKLFQTYPIKEIEDLRKYKNAKERMPFLGIDDVDINKVQ